MPLAGAGDAAPGVDDAHGAGCRSALLVDPRGGGAVSGGGEIAGELNGEALEVAGLEGLAVVGVGGDPVSDVRLADRHRADVGPAEKVLVPEGAVVGEVVGLDEVPIGLLLGPDFVGRGRVLGREGSWQNGGKQNECEGLQRESGHLVSGQDFSWVTTLPEEMTDRSRMQ